MPDKKKGVPAPSPSLMGKLYNLTSQLTYPLPKVVGNNAERVRRTMYNILNYDDARRELRGVPLIISDSRLDAGPSSGVYGFNTSFYDPNFNFIKMHKQHSSDPEILEHELGHARQDRLELPLRNDEAADYIKDESWTKYISDYQKRGIRKPFYPSTLINERARRGDINLPAPSWMTTESTRKLRVAPLKQISYRKHLPTTEKP